MIKANESTIQTLYLCMYMYLEWDLRLFLLGDLDLLRLRSAKKKDNLEIYNEIVNVLFLYKLEPLNSVLKVTKEISSR